MKISDLFPSADIEALRQIINASKRIVITCHLSPDGDALGSSLGLASLLAAIGKTVHVVTPDAPPSSLSFLPGFSSIVAASMHTDSARGLIANSDLIFCLDFNHLKRIDRLADPIVRSSARRVVIDHHLGPDIEADIVFSAPDRSSTSMLVYLIARQLGLSDKISRDAATCIMTGMITDTGNFAYNAEDPDLYLISAELVARGVEKDRITREVMRTYTLSRMRLNLFALSERLTLFPEYGAALIALTADDLRRFDYQKGDTEGLVNVPLGLPGVEVSLFLREESEPGRIKVSSRSLGAYPANRLCSEFFGGGGHVNAAGGEFSGTLEEAVAHAEKAFAGFTDYLTIPD